LLAARLKRRSPSLRDVRRMDCNITLEKLRGDHNDSTSRNDLSDPSRLRAPKTRNLHERDLVGRDDVLHRAKVKQQAMRQRWTDAWQSLKHVDLLRCEALRLSVVSLQNAGFRSAHPGRQSRQSF
jgi:hypothetical protein